MENDEPNWDTATMAELFVNQGQIGRAVGIYRKLVRDDPADHSARARLVALEGGNPSPVPVATEAGPMSFRETMQSIVKSVPGATACVLMGYDGIAVDTYTIGGGDLDIPNLLTEYSAAALSLRRVTDEQPLSGEISELVIATNQITTVLRLLNDEFFLAVILGPSGLSGKARYMMRQAAPALLRELT